MKNISLLIILIFSCVTLGNAQCPPASASVDLDIANVRAKIRNGGDMWWDLLGTAKYEVPKGSGKSAQFAAGLWIGGKDAFDNLRIAAQTYRQSGNDFWPGPMDTVNGTVSNLTCIQYDRLWKVNRQEVVDFIAGSSGPTAAMTSWPGNGDVLSGQSRFLAPFEDLNNDGYYNVSAGDYPKFDGINGTYACNGYLHGDQSIWWVINDVGNIHSETNSAYAIGLEIHCQAFAFNSANQDISNTTFYEYKTINRSSLSLFETYFGFWTDLDLGNYLDDYVGCDVSRGLAYAYNGDANDDGSDGYGLFPPSSGIDFLQGPFADNNDGIDNNRNGVTDESNEQIIMSKFVYYDNDFTVTGNPSLAQHYYDYLRGVWKDGTQQTYGGNGHNSSSINSDFMFPDNSDPLHFGTGGVVPTFNWSEINSFPGQSNIPGDRRYILSAGKFSLLPGEVNYISVAALWARDSAGGPFYSRAALRRADDYAQNLADHCFDINLVNIQTVELEKISFYPNPASSTLTFEIPYTDGKTFTLNVYSSTGKLLKTESGYTERLKKIDIRDLTAGLYVFKISSNAGNSYSGKFMKL